MSADRILMLKLLGDTSSMDKSLRKSEGKLKSFGRGAAKWGSAIAADLAIEGVQKLGAFLESSFQGWKDHQTALAQTTAVLKSTGGAAGVASDDVVGLAKSLESLTGVDDLAIQRGENLLLTFTKIKDGVGKGNDIFTQATGVLTDMSVALGTDVKGSALQLGKALNDPIKGVASLTEVGVTFSEKQKTLIARLVKTGDIAGAQRVIIKELKKEFGGSAKEWGGTLEGQLAKINTKLGDFGEQIVGVAMPALTDFVTYITDTGIPQVEAFAASLSDPSSAAGGFIASTAATLKDLGERIGPKVSGVIDAMGAAWDALQPKLAAILTFIQPVIDLLGGAMQGGLAFTLDLVTTALQAVADLLNGDVSGAFTTITTAVGTLGEDLNTFFVGLPDKIAGWAVEIATEASNLGGGIANAIMGAILGFATGAGNLAGGLAQGLADFFTGLPGQLIDWATSIGTGAANIGTAIYNGIAGGVNDVVGLVRGVINKVITALNSINDFSFPRSGFEVNTLFGNAFVGVDAGSIKLWPEIPYLAKGGIVNKPTLAMIGEAGPEAVVPLGRGGSAGGATYNITVNAHAVDPASVGREVVRAIRAYERIDGKAWRSA